MSLDPNRRMRRTRKSSGDIAKLLETPPRRLSRPDHARSKDAGDEVKIKRRGRRPFEWQSPKDRRTTPRKARRPTRPRTSRGLKPKSMIYSPIQRDCPPGRQCVATTEDGTRCKNPVACTEGCNYYCYLHALHHRTGVICIDHKIPKCKECGDQGIVQSRYPLAGRTHSTGYPCRRGRQGIYDEEDWKRHCGRPAASLSKSLERQISQVIKEPIPGVKGRKIIGPIELEGEPPKSERLIELKPRDSRKKSARRANANDIRGSARRANANDIRGSQKERDRPNIRRDKKYDVVKKSQQSEGFREIRKTRKTKPTDDKKKSKLFL
jgi:hypothetical protein